MASRCSSSIRQVMVQPLAGVRSAEQRVPHDEQGQIGKEPGQMIVDLGEPEEREAHSGGVNVAPMKARSESDWSTMGMPHAGTPG